MEEIKSLINVQYIESVDNTLYSRSFIGDRLPGTQGEELREEYRQKALDHPDYPLIYLSRNCQYGGIVIRTDFNARIKRKITTDSDAAFEPGSSPGSQFDTDDLMDSGPTDQDLTDQDPMVLASGPLAAEELEQTDIREYPKFMKALRAVLADPAYAWGKADTMAVTDVVSPRDASEFIFFKIEDARFGQWNVSSTLYRDNTSLFVFLTPLPATDKTPETGTHYFRSLPGNKNGYPVDDSPELGDMEAGMKMDHFFSKTEVSVMGGRFYAYSPVYETQGNAAHKIYPAYTMAGRMPLFKRDSIDIVPMSI